MTPSPSNETLALFRRMVAEPTAENWADDELSAIIEKYPIADAAGNEPGEPDWTPTYDLNAAAADVWDMKAAALASEFDASADGARVQRSQRYEHALRMAARYRALRVARVVAVTTFEEVASPEVPEDADER